VQKDESNKPLPASAALRRALVTLLYANWEGFFADAAEAYSDLLKRWRLPLSSVPEVMLVRHIAHQVKRWEQAQTLERENTQRDIVSSVRCPESARIWIPADINWTRSNLRYSVLRENAEILGLDISTLSLRDKFIDVKLCDARNAIAHGKWSVPTYDDCMVLFEAVTDMMEKVRAIFVFAANKLDNLHSMSLDTRIARQS
jgi:hypothetical protein